MREHLCNTGTKSTLPTASSSSSSSSVTSVKDTTFSTAFDTSLPVQAFLMGSNEWRHEPTWPPQQTSISFFFASNNNLSLKPESHSSPSSSFWSDPEKPVTDPFIDSTGPHNYNCLEKRKDVLLFESDPMTHPLAILGQILVEVFVSLEKINDVDLWVRLVDKAPDGSACNLMHPSSNIERLSEMVKTDSGNTHSITKINQDQLVYKMSFTRMFTGHTFLPGHKICLQISGSFYPHMSRKIRSTFCRIPSWDCNSSSLRKLCVKNSFSTSKIDRLNNIIT